MKYENYHVKCLYFTSDPNLDTFLDLDSKIMYLDLFHSTGFNTGIDPFFSSRLDKQFVCPNVGRSREYSADSVLPWPGQHEDPGPP